MCGRRWKKGCGGARPLSKQQTTAPLGDESYNTNGEGSLHRFITAFEMAVCLKKRIILCVYKVTETTPNRSILPPKSNKTRREIATCFCCKLSTRLELSTNVETIRRNANQATQLHPKSVKNTRFSHNPVVGGDSRLLYADSHLPATTPACDSVSSITAEVSNPLSPHRLRNNKLIKLSEQTRSSSRVTSRMPRSRIISNEWRPGAAAPLGEVPRVTRDEFRKRQGQHLDERPRRAGPVGVVVSAAPPLWSCGGGAKSGVALTVAGMGKSWDVVEIPNELKTTLLTQIIITVMVNKSGLDAVQHLALKSDTTPPEVSILSPFGGATSHTLPRCSDPRVVGTLATVHPDRSENRDIAASFTSTGLSRCSSNRINVVMDFTVRFAAVYKKRR
ncbi:hypothetical protein GEV33_014234 [Tenebrio molitor]|uniref:Uncharacterized protein n=1 Tax=Tenebrio molitor TaxID=7067 RepID=A0A8J6H638_TENMO|nr:hypothetical protein GEV33_014234 [Tenebrio molitor]